ncbi:MAG TPA: glycosyltransferase [Longimicrobiales bacterium]|nr:glycosyltransferase [Longimicrobiales bacterium]
MQSNRGHGMMPLVLHYRSRFPVPSETFIRTTVTSHSRYRAVVSTHEIVRGTAWSDDPPLRLDECAGGRVASLARRWLPLAEIRQRRARVARAIRAVCPEVVHAHFAAEGVAAWPAARRAGIPLVVTFYGFDATELPRDWRWRRRIRALLHHATLVLAEGPSLRERLIDLGAPPHRTRVHPIPIRIESFPFRLPAPRERAIVLQACRFVPKKGVDLTLRAFARAADGTGSRLRLIGDGPERPALEALARELGIAERVEFAGMRTHEQYARDLADADVFIHPSRFGPKGDGEGGAPTALIEAQATGLPIVSTTHADIPFVAGAGGALLAPEDDLDQLAAHLRWLLQHPERWADLARAGRRHVERQHEASLLAERLESHYDDARAMMREAQLRAAKP